MVIPLKTIHIGRTEAELLHPRDFSMRRLSMVTFLSVLCLPTRVCVSLRKAKKERLYPVQIRSRMDMVRTP